MGQTTNVLFAGVGGQGVILVSELLALTAMAVGYDVKQGEFHGVAQRGGMVFSHVRFGDRVYSPMTKRGEVDYLVAMEKLEGLRYAHFVRDGGVVIVNDHRIEPIHFPGDTRTYPDAPIEFMQSKGFKVLVVPATERAIALGNHRVANVILLGVLSHFLDIPAPTWEQTLQERIPQRFLELNQRAFTEGRALALSMSG